MGHGWVYPNKHGSKARCGGPGLCGTCSAEKIQKDAEDAKRWDDAVNAAAMRNECLFCKGRAWVLFEQPNVLNVKGGCCPKCNIDGDTPENKTAELVTLVLRIATADEVSHGDSIRPSKDPKEDGFQAED